MLSFLKWFFIIIAAFAIIAIYLVFTSWIFMLIWNYVAVGVFGAPELTLWNAIALNVLLSMIGSFFTSNK